MNKQSLAKQVNELFQWSIESLANHSSLNELRSLLLSSQERLQAPMRAAIIGRIKAGKSTAMNALLGHIVVPTGSEEVTFNNTWFRWGELPASCVYYKDKRPPKPIPFATLDEVISRSSNQLDELLEIDYVEVKYPSDLLRHINLVDTPGLGSYYHDDSKNTERFIRMTEKEASSADAVLYLFDRSIADSEQKIVAEFVGPTMGQMTPLNTIGVLTMVDSYWPSEPDPTNAAKRVVSRLQNMSSVQQTLYSIVPFCGLLACGAQSITSEEFNGLVRLAQLDENRLIRLMKSASRFITSEDTQLNITSAEREALFKRLGLYGVWFAYHRIQNGITDRSQLATELLKESGLAELRQLILSHFGNRSFIIKLDKILRKIMALDLKLSKSVHASDQAKLGEIMKRFEALKMAQHPIRELGVLRCYYENKLNFNAEEASMLLQVTGENGDAPSDRLGLQNTSTDKLLSLARTRIQYWKTIAVDSGSDSETADAAQVLARSYERIAYQLYEINS